LSVLQRKSALLDLDDLPLDGVEICLLLLELLLELLLVALPLHELPL
jgi:hypothetical protein